MVLTPEGAGARLVQLRSVYGDPVSLRDDRAEYARTSGEINETVIVDARLQAPLEVTLNKNGAPELHVVMKYEPQLDGSAVLSSKRIERAAADGKGFTAVQSTYRNLYVARRD
jgi:hypothetical protein